MRPSMAVRLNDGVPSGKVAIRAPRAFDGERFLADGVTVLCADGKIVGVERAGAPIPEGWVVEDFASGTVLPGLIDSHVHLCGDSQQGALDRLPSYSDDELTAVIEDALAAHLVAGVTTVRDLGDRRWAVVDRRNRAGDDVTVPTIVASGPPITIRGGHCWNMGGEADTLDELRDAVRERAERGVDVIKIMASGGAMTPGTDVMVCQYSLDALRAVVDEAHRLGLRVTAHAHGLPAVVQAVEAGVDGIEHCSCMTENGIEHPAELVAAIAEKGIFVCPTVGRSGDAVPPPAMRDFMARTGVTLEDRARGFAKMHRAGVVIVSGVDAGIGAAKPHGIIATAITGLVEGGVSIADALASATSVGALACGVEDRKGSLRAGFDADVLVVDGDATTDVTALGRVRRVYRAGSPL